MEQGRGQEEMVYKASWQCTKVEQFHSKDAAIASAAN